MRCTFRPDGCVPASQTLSDEPERPTGYTEATAGALGVLLTACGAPATLTRSQTAKIFTGFHRYRFSKEIQWKKVAGLWTVTRNGPRIQPSSYKWYTVMYIWTCWLRPRLPDSQERGRTTHGVYRGNGGGAGRPGDRLRRSGDTHSIANRQIFTGFLRYRFSKEIQWKQIPLTCKFAWPDFPSHSQPTVALVPLVQASPGREA